MSAEGINESISKLTEEITSVDSIDQLAAAISAEWLIDTKITIEEQKRHLRFTIQNDEHAEALQRELLGKFNVVVQQRPETEQLQFDILIIEK